MKMMTIESLQSMRTAGAVFALVCLVAGCGGPPNNNPLLDDARVSLAKASDDPAVVAGAPETLDRAEVTLLHGERLLDDGADQEEVEHYAYLTKQYVAIAEETAALRRHEEAIKKAETDRQKVVLLAREREAERAEAKAAEAQQQAATERQDAEIARKRAEDALERARELGEKIRELEAKQTERGLVLTLSEVLFDVGKATLKDGGQRAVGQLATFLQEYPERRVLVEGHTDETGSLQLNLDLSKHRAESVKAALMGMGIPANRIGTIGHGPAYPVASNNTAAGRQQNRRVEIIISNEDGVIAERQP